MSLLDVAPCGNGSDDWQFGRTSPSVFTAEGFKTLVTFGLGAVPRKLCSGVTNHDNLNSYG
jgi:hypothetical protein